MLCIDGCERRKGFGQRLAPDVPPPTGITAGDAEDDGDIMEEDCDTVDNVEYEGKEDEDMDLLDLELVNCCIEMEGNSFDVNGRGLVCAAPLPIDA